MLQHLVPAIHEVLLDARRRQQLAERHAEHLRELNQLRQVGARFSRFHVREMRGRNAGGRRELAQAQSFGNPAAAQQRGNLAGVVVRVLGMDRHRSGEVYTFCECNGRFSEHSTNRPLWR